MTKPIQRLITILILAAFILAACAPAVTTGEPAPADTGAGTQVEPAADSGGDVAQVSGQGEILQRVLDRGTVICGIHTELAGFGYLDEAGNNLGFDIDLCRAVAAAVLSHDERGSHRGRDCDRHAGRRTSSEAVSRKSRSTAIHRGLDTGRARG